MLLSGAGDPGLPVYQERSESILDSARSLADHLSAVSVHLIPCFESRFENAGPLRQATQRRAGPLLIRGVIQTGSNE